MILNNTLKTIKDYKFILGDVIAVVAWYLNLPMQSVPITSDVVSSNLDQGEMYKHYVIKFVSDLRQVGGFFRVLRFPSPIQLTATI